MPDEATKKTFANATVGEDRKRMLKSTEEAIESFTKELQGYETLRDSKDTSVRQKINKLEELLSHYEQVKEILEELIKED
jgi:DNA-binding transcriptional regulator GbsR (MarR family)